MKALFYCATKYGGYKRKIYDSSKNDGSLEKLSLSQISKRERCFFCNEDIVFCLLRENTEWLLVINHIPCQYVDYLGRVCYNNLLFHLSEDDLHVYYPLIIELYNHYEHLIELSKKVIVTAEDDFSIDFKPILTDRTICRGTAYSVPMELLIANGDLYGSQNDEMTMGIKYELITKSKLLDEWARQ